MIGKTVQGQRDEKNILLNWLSSYDTLPLLANHFNTWKCASTGNCKSFLIFFSRTVEATIDVVYIKAHF